jgi:hypothetical protein
MCERDPFFATCATTVYQTVFDSLHLCFKPNLTPPCNEVGSTIAETLLHADNHCNEAGSTSAETLLCADNHDGRCTWRVGGGDLVCLMKTEDGKTLVYNEKYNAVYGVQADFVYPRQVPPMTVCMGQFIVDHVGQPTETARIILYDILFHEGVFLGETPCSERYEQLRRLGTLLHTTLIHIQWVGMPMNVVQWRKLAHQVPHQIVGVMYLPNTVSLEQCGISAIRVYPLHSMHLQV